MGKRWANIPQWDWMTERIPQYKERAALGQKREFFKETTEDLIKTFSLAPTEEAIRVLGLETARQAVWDLYSSRVENWFPNATRTTAAASACGKRGTLEPKKKMLQHWQVYQKLYWEKGLEERVNDECKRLHGGPLSQLDPQKRFPVRNRIIIELYKRESAEVTHIVNEAREGRRADPLTNEDISRNLTKLPRTLKQFGENLASKTDWSGVIAFGGPHPSYDGKVYTYVRPVGTTKEGLTFDEFLGKETYLEWVSQLDAFFDACYDDDDRARRSSGTTPTAAGPSGGNKSGPRPSSSNASLKNAVPTQPENKQEDIQQPQAPKSEYERTREINIARNKIVLGILDSTIGCGDEPEVLVEELTKVGIELNAQELKQTLDKIKLLCSRSSTTDQDAGSRPQSLSNGTDADAPPKEPVLSTTEGNGVPAVPVNVQHVDAGSTPATSRDVAAPTDDVSMGSSKSPPGDVALSDAQEIPAAGNGDTRMEIEATKDSVGKEMEQTFVDNDKEGGKGLAAQGAVLLADLEASVPSYLKPVWKYLLSVSKADAWCSLLYHFVKFEAQDHGKKRMNTTNRPKAVQAWIKSHNKTVSPSVDLAVFPTQTLGWWKANQPEWRIQGTDSVDPSTFIREAPRDADWTSLARSGSTGIYTVVMAVSWWILEADAEWTKDLCSLVDDITWVLKEMATSRSADENQGIGSQEKVVALMSTKRGHDDSDDAQKTSSGRQVKRPRRLEVD
ncbi:hypothetical protein EST38_g13426 [Candolleomyces aberdarensis]|uniref:Uncharacterized protein n=1 Tax=Candolleomyces aberdarensis TaxID=2316362 RepID=A0A4Q2D0Q3_9AGAR|nr:hypothetical protein EST38_g13426 [Candolleomyces aberdarensis]